MERARGGAAVDRGFGGAAVDRDRGGAAVDLDRGVGSAGFFLDLLTAGFAQGLPATGFTFGLSALAFALVLAEAGLGFDFDRRGFTFVLAATSAGSGAGRHSVSVLPRCWTGAASRSAQICREQPFPLDPIVAEYADLDELVRPQIDVDLVQHRRCEPVMADADDRVQVMRLRAKLAPRRGC